MIAFDGGSLSRKGVQMVAESPLFRGLPCHLLMSGSPVKDVPKQIEWARKTLEDAGFEAPAAIVPGDAEQVIARAVQTGNRCPDHGCLRPLAAAQPVARQQDFGPATLGACYHFAVALKMTTSRKVGVGETAALLEDRLANLREELIRTAAAAEPLN